MATLFAKIAALCTIAVLLQSAGLVLFVLGYFPVKPVLVGVSDTKSYLPGCAGEDWVKGNGGVSSNEESQDWENSPIPSQYDRLVFMVIDGLPAEFVLGKAGGKQPVEIMKALPYTQNLLSTGLAVGYHAKAESPTVTMPRLKAMTSGAIAGYLDVAYNFNTQALLEDNWIAQVARAGWRMVMLGDNTWLKLFPNVFGRHDGVHSFFVKDTVEVDRNVTRHLDVELVSDDWDLLVLHYLGLDHVGHLGGRNSPLMAPKLKEMDEVIRRIHQNVQTEGSSASRTLLVVTSDHGMTDSGNHGGATAQETDSLALFVFGSNSNSSAPLLSESFETWETFQVDIVPTIALLLGVPVPQNSVGVILPQLFDSLTQDNQLKALEVNSWQLLRLVHARSPGSACVMALCRTADDKGENKSIPRSKDSVQTLCSLFESALELQREWKTKHSTSNLDVMNVPSFEEVKNAYLQFLKPTSEWLARGSTEKNNILLLCGSSMILISTLLLLLGLHTSCKVTSRDSGKLGRQTSLQIIAIGGVCAHALSLGSSSFVEEEQYTWHFLVSTLFIVLLRLSLQGYSGKDQDLSTKSSTEVSNNNSVQIMKVGSLLLLGRTLRSWHRSGVNWTHLPDLAKYLESGSPLLVTAIRIVCVCTVTIASCNLISKSLSKTLRSIVMLGVTFSATLIILYTRDTRTSQESLWATLTARMIFGLLGGISLLTLLAVPWTVPLKSFHSSSSSAMSTQSARNNLKLSGLQVEVEDAMDATGKALVSCWCLLQLLLQQPVNAGPVLLLLLQLLLTVSVLRKCAFAYQPWVPILALNWLGASGHFGLGNSNTLATVDVAGAYIGLTSHSTILSGLLAFFITYGSPLLYMQALLLLKSSRRQLLKDVRRTSTSRLIEIFVLPVVLPLALNSIVLLVFTAVLFLMKDHLFVWSVFAPKYLYVCMNTCAVYLGTIVVEAVEAYDSFVFYKRVQQADVDLKKS